MIVDDLLSLAKPIDDFELLPGNARTGDVEAIVRSLRMFGQRKPIVARRDGIVIAGNHTLQAARVLGWDRVAAVFVDDDDLRAKAYALADNRTAELGGYDDALLADMIGDVSEADKLMLEATGWNDDDLAELLAKLDETPALSMPDLEDLGEDAPAHTRPGDRWQLGPHALLCGDSRDAEAVSALLAGVVINLAVTSPPYAQQRVYDEASGFEPIPPDAYVEWFAPVAANVAAHLAADGSWLVNIKPAADLLDTSLYVHDLVAAHVRQWGWHFATEFCWERPGVPKQPVLRLKNAFEPVYQFARGRWKFRPLHVAYESDDAIALVGKGGGATTWDTRQGKGGVIPRRSGVGPLADLQGTPGEQWWNDRREPGMAYPSNRLPTYHGTHEAVGHAAAFPVGLPRFLAMLFTDHGDTVFDPFTGSGSTLLAAHDLGRIGYGIELSPRYCDMTCKRFEAATGIVPVRDGQEVSFR